MTTTPARQCPFCGHEGIGACITRVHAPACRRYRGLSFRYHWQTPTTAGEGAQAFASEAEFESELARWNRAAPGLYRYRAGDHAGRMRPGSLA